MLLARDIMSAKNLRRPLLNIILDTFRNILANLYRFTWGKLVKLPKFK